MSSPVAQIQVAQIQVAPIQNTNCIHKWCLDSNCPNNHNQKQNDYQELVVLSRKATVEYTKMLQVLQPNIIRKDRTVSEGDSTSTVVSSSTIDQKNCKYGLNCFFGTKCFIFHDQNQLELFKVRDIMITAENDLQKFEKCHDINCINRGGRDGYVANLAFHKSNSATGYNSRFQDGRQGSNQSSCNGSRNGSRNGSPDGRGPHENRAFNYEELEKRFNSCNVGGNGSRGGSTQGQGRGNYAHGGSMQGQGGSNYARGGSTQGQGGSNYARGGGNDGSYGLAGCNSFHDGSNGGGNSFYGGGNGARGGNW